MYRTLNETKMTSEINKSAVCHASYNDRLEIVTTRDTQCEAKEIGGVNLHTGHYNLISALTFIHNSQTEISDPDSLQVPEKQSHQANLLSWRSLHTDIGYSSRTTVRIQTFALPC